MHVKTIPLTTFVLHFYVQGCSRGGNAAIPSKDTCTYSGHEILEDLRARGMNVTNEEWHIDGETIAFIDYDSKTSDCAAVSLAPGTITLSQPSPGLTYIVLYQDSKGHMGEQRKGFTGEECCRGDVPELLKAHWHWIIPRAFLGCRKKGVQADPEQAQTGLTAQGRTMDQGQELDHNPHQDRGPGCLLTCATSL
ncbi:hypothetical protein AAFF_G00198930 [Aldrovandia affinis]|uniref:Uncharacterized protein n=1 Tax=Aldrovandia affinis TaxID=143900 RepID=A0AAD7W5P0_9TELE|nr:hypothetical protein AAFF_G00198930 [Aldrovandia affinis]